MAKRTPPQIVEDAYNLLTACYAVHACMGGEYEKGIKDWFSAYHATYSKVTLTAAEKASQDSIAENEQLRCRIRELETQLGQAVAGCDETRLDALEEKFAHAIDGIDAKFATIEQRLLSLQSSPEPEPLPNEQTCKAMHTCLACMAFTSAKGPGLCVKCLQKYPGHTASPGDQLRFARDRARARMGAELRKALAEKDALRLVIEDRDKSLADARRALRFRDEDLVALQAELEEVRADRQKWSDAFDRACVETARRENEILDLRARVHSLLGVGQKG